MILKPLFAVLEPIFFFAVRNLQPQPTDNGASFSTVIPNQLHAVLPSLCGSSEARQIWHIDPRSLKRPRTQ